MVESNERLNRLRSRRHGAVGETGNYNAYNMPNEAEAQHQERIQLGKRSRDEMERSMTHDRSGVTTTTQDSIDRALKRVRTTDRGMDSPNNLGKEIKEGVNDKSNKSGEEHWLLSTTAKDETSNAVWKRTLRDLGHRPADDSHLGNELSNEGEKERDRVLKALPDLKFGHTALRRQEAVRRMDRVVERERLGVISGVETDDRNQANGPINRKGKPGHDSGGVRFGKVDDDDIGERRTSGSTLDLVLMNRARSDYYSQFYGPQMLSTELTRQQGDLSVTRRSLASTHERKLEARTEGGCQKSKERITVRAESSESSCWQPPTDNPPDKRRIEDGDHESDVEVVAVITPSREPQPLNPKNCYVLETGVRDNLPVLQQEDRHRSWRRSRSHSRSRSRNRDKYDNRRTHHRRSREREMHGDEKRSKRKRHQEEERKRRRRDRSESRSQSRERGKSKDTDVSSNEDRRYRSESPRRGRSRSVYDGETSKRGTYDKASLPFTHTGPTLIDVDRLRMERLRREAAERKKAEEITGIKDWASLDHSIYKS